VICDPWAVAVVPFPFSDRPAARRRPALVLSRRGFNKRGHTILAMITTASHSTWPGDTVIEEAAGAGLRTECIVRLKLFTLDNRLVLKRIGSLSKTDRAAVAKALKDHTAIE